MRVRLVLPALAEARAPGFRPIKYALFPPLGLCTLAGHLDPDDEVEIVDEHVSSHSHDGEPDLVAMQVYVTSARRAYRIADAYRSRGVRVAMGGLHPTACPSEAAAHADHVFQGPGEDIWPQFLSDLRAGSPRPVYRSSLRSLDGMPPVRRDLIDRRRYLVPNALVVSRGCPHSCDFCYKHAFYGEGRGHYVEAVDRSLAEIDALPGRHLYFLDDHLFADPRHARVLFDGMRGMGRVFQSAATVASVLAPGLLERAVDAGLRSLFVGFETSSAGDLVAHGKAHNAGRDYRAAIERLHSFGVMVNASFVFGFDGDEPSVFDRTVDWALDRGVETATFHILTPYPGTRLHAQLSSAGRLLHSDWDRYDTRHAVFQPARMSPQQLEEGYARAYRDFYSWSSIARAAATKPTWAARARHLGFTAAWRRAEPVWDVLLRLGIVGRARPLLEAALDGTSRLRAHLSGSDEPRVEASRSASHRLADTPTPM